MEAAYAEYAESLSFTRDQPSAIVPSILGSTTSPNAINGDVQEGSAGLEGTGVGDVVIDITPPVDTEKADVGEVDDSEVVRGNAQPEMP